VVRFFGLPAQNTGLVILPWSAALANGERIAEVRGHLCKVQVSYNPDDHTLEIDAPVPLALMRLCSMRSPSAASTNTPQTGLSQLRPLPVIRLLSISSSVVKASEIPPYPSKNMVFAGACATARRRQDTMRLQAMRRQAATEAA
jgi:hypothetical protein